MLGRLLFVIIVLQGCSGSPPPGTDQEPDAPSPPNVIVILSDDQGWGDFSFTGNRNLATPSIDRLGYEGAYFENFYVQPVCSPTRAEFLTGRYAVRSGVYDTSEGGERIDLDESTIAEMFLEAGYATAAYGKWHSGMQYPYHPNGRGFEDFYGFCSGHWGSYFSPMLEHNGEIVYGEGYLPDDLTDHGLAFIDAHRDEPFFLYLPYNTPHSPMQVPDSLWERFENRELGMTAGKRYEENPGFTRAALAMCENIDYNVGRILAKLEALGLDDNTIIVYFNDNGPNSYRWNGGMKGRKGSTDEGGVRSPLFIRWPGKVAPGQTVTGVAGAIDLLPTLAGLTGVDVPDGKPLDGISLADALLSARPPDDRVLFNQWNGRISLRNARFRLDTDGALFDIAEDRGQTVDVREEHPEIYRQLLSARADYEQNVASELPASDTRTFPLGHPGAVYTQLPARDGTAHGSVIRSNRWPNCSFFTNWSELSDEITWDVQVPEQGLFEVTLYYTCKEGDQGSLLELSFGEAMIQKKLEEAWDPPLEGMEKDRVPREESYVKQFKPLTLGRIRLTSGEGTLRLKALEIPGETVADVRLLQFKRIEE